jgi:hypothetical protein
MLVRLQKISTEEGKAKKALHDSILKPETFETLA